ncbi:FadR/GntR family transcriptional regulator [Streptomyces odontomachi]|uniref:FadR/GntR family transcriptional regulator n=1 Tax=Streptomyces odontomachi TaxID=2944940 RepID=UPI00210B375C|nr:FCD domain-containing protein [Streptomyces sp. ODS25]
MSLPLKSLSQPRRRRGLHAEVVHELGQMIVSNGELTDGPLIMDDLVQHFGASRTVIREACRCLESKGLITARPNVGIHIRPPDEWNLLDPDIVEWRALGPQAHHQRNELHELRQVVELFAARLAATTQDLATWRLLTASVTDMEDAVRHGQADEFDHADTCFHQYLIRAAGSVMVHHLSTIVPRGLIACTEPTTCERTEASVKRHAAIVSALRRQDREEAERAMRDLLAAPLDSALERTT